MNLIGIAKTGSSLIVSMGAGAVVTNAIKATTPADLKTYQKITLGVGAFVLSSMVGDAASKYTNEKIDEGAETLKETAENLKTAQDEN